MTQKRKDNLAYAAAQRFYQLQNNGVYPTAFAFRKYAAVVAHDGNRTYSVSLFDLNGKFITNIAC